MNKTISRRNFMVASAAACAGGLIAPGVINLEGAESFGGFKTTLHKALITGIPNEESLTALKNAGFEGIECSTWNADPAAAEQGRKIADKMEMRVHSVLRGWTNFNNPQSVESDIQSVETALKTAQILGADAVLLVPCRTGAKGPQPWEFDIEFNEKTGHVTRVAQGDNSAYKEYIEAQNQATDASREALKKLIPAAEKTGVVIAVENVWNNLWVKPALFANFVASFENKWIQTYFDIGNHVKYAPPEEWIRALGKLIAKCHIKDFKLSENGQGGKFVDIRDGSVNWPLVRQELDKIGYNGWMTIEGSGGLSKDEQGKRLDLIIAGK